MKLYRLVSTSLEAIQAQRPFPPNFRLVVAVSGGPDSLALLHLLHRMLPGDRLVAAHLDHRLRPESGADARFVADTAAAWGVAAVVEAADVAAMAAAQRLSLETAGRQARYAFLARIAAQVDAAAVAVGHNADDQAETVLMHLIRGSGVTGLRGMQPAALLPADPDRWLIRPLLAAPRRWIEAYCQDHGLQPRRDPSNRDPQHLRNRIRHELLPLLETISPQVRGSLRQLAALLTDEDALLHAQLQALWPQLCAAAEANTIRLRRAAWQAQPAAMQRRLLRHALAQLCAELPDVGFETIEQARLLASGAVTGGESHLPGGVTLRVGYETIDMGVTPPADLLAGPQLMAGPAPLPIPGVLALGNGWQLRAGVLAAQDRPLVEQNGDPWQAFVDVGEQTALLVRARLPGERMQPLGMNGRSSPVKAIMVNRKLPRALRDRWPLVVSGTQPVWLAGQVLDERARVTGASRRIVHLVCVPPEDEAAAA